MKINKLHWLKPTNLFLLQIIASGVIAFLIFLTGYIFSSTYTEAYGATITLNVFQKIFFWVGMIFAFPILYIGNMFPSEDKFFWDILPGISNSYEVHKLLSLAWVFFLCSYYEVCFLTLILRIFLKKIPNRLIIWSLLYLITFPVILVSVVAVFTSPQAEKISLKKHISAENFSEEAFQCVYQPEWPELLEEYPKITRYRKCYLQKVILTSMSSNKAASLCEKTFKLENAPAELRDCYTVAAIHFSDSKVCQKITWDKYGREQCIAIANNFPGLASSDPNEYCRLFSLKGICYAKAVILQHNTALCKEWVQAEGLIPSAYEKSLYEKKGAELCERMSSPDWRAYVEKELILLE